MRERGVIATRQLAKRQLTWLRSWPSEMLTFDSLDAEIYDKIENYLGKRLTSN
jgi:tRNA dimethylallyltransferase